MIDPVSILVANYKGGPVAELCIESVRRFTPEGAYRLIVLNDYDPLDTDGPYLRTARDRGWIELHEATERLYHGGALNRLLNEICDTRIAVNLDNDTQITGPDWLDAMTAPLDAPDVLAVCDARPFNCVSTQGYVPPFYRFWFASMDMERYRDLGPIDWRFAYADRRVYPYSAMFKDVEGVDLPQKQAEEFDANRVCIDPGSQLWVKVHCENPKGYRVVPIPPSMSAKYRHIGHISHWADVPDDHDEWTRKNKRTRYAFVEAELRRLRCRS